MIWLFGRPAAGKTTLAHFLANKFENSIILDGDKLRQNISKDLGFSIEDRFEHIKRTLNLAITLQHKNNHIILALITPMEVYREYIKSKLNTCQLIYVNCSLEVCQKRDPKGLYKKAQNNKIKHFTGLSQAFEEPKNQDYSINTSYNSIQESGEKILEFLKTKNY